MTVKESLDKFKKIQAAILEYLEKDNDAEENFQNLSKSIELPKENTENLYDITLLLHLLASIAENHFLEHNFYPKIEKILLLLKDEITKNCTDSDIFNIFKDNKRVLLFLFDEQMIKMNNYIGSQMQSKKYKKENYPQYFFPEIKSYIKPKKTKYDISDSQLLVLLNNYYKSNDFSSFMSVSKTYHQREAEKKEVKNLPNWFSEYSQNLPDDFYENRKNGQNTSHICELIQKDLIDDFITYVGRENYVLSSTIEKSYCETNLFLLRRPKNTLIEYASFYGSVQIFKYLFKNGVELTPSVWLYAVHSNNPELIHLLEDSKIEPDSYLQVYNEAIRCHHNSVANYINKNYLGQNEEGKNEEKEEEEEKNDDDEIKDSFIVSLKSYNFELINEDSIKDNSSFSNLCKYDYCTFVKHLIHNQNVDLNEKQMKEVEYGYDETYTEETPILHCAIENDNINIIKLLLQNKKLDINCVKKFIAKKPKSKSRDFMLDYKVGTEWVSWNEWDDDNYDIVVEMTALNYAIEKGNIEIVNLLLTNEKLDVNLFSKFSMESQEENYLLMTPLQYAIEKENIEVIKALLLNNNIDPNVISVALSNNPDGNGKHIQRREMTALHIAVDNENIEIIKILLENEKVDVNINRTWFSYRDEHEEWSSNIKGYEKSALHIAIYRGNTDIVELLLKDKRTDVNLPQIAVKSDIYINDSEEWDSRRAPEENPTFKDYYLWADIPNKWIQSFDEKKSEKTPLLSAVEFGNLKIIGILLDNENVDVNLRSKFVEIKVDEKDGKNESKVEEKTTLCYAIEIGKTDLYDNVEVVKLLLTNKKIDIQFPSKISNAPRLVGDEEEEEGNKDEDAQSKMKDVTPLQIATETDNQEIIELLKNHK